MISGNKVLAIIPARGGSKGVPRKNIREIDGKPLLAWSIEEAQKSKYIDRLIVSSEDEEIIQTAMQWGCEAPFIRPKEIARDDTPGVDVLLHAVEMIPGYDYIVLLQPTSPLRSVEDIDGCIELCIKQNSNSCVSVTYPNKSPFWMYTIAENERIEPLIETDIKADRRQDLPEVVALNGAVYVINLDWLLNTKKIISDDTVAYLMPDERSIDIDSELDFEVAEYMMLKRNK